MDLKWQICDLLKDDRESEGHGLTTNSIWERLQTLDPTLPYANVVEVLFALLNGGVVEGGDLDIKGGVREAVWRIVADREKWPVELKPVPFADSSENSGGEERKPASAKCPRCGQSGSVVAGWCTVCMKPVLST